MSKGLEALNLIITRLHPSPDNVAKAMHEVKIVEKSLKALEIIKTKCVNVHNLISYELNLDNSYEEYLDDYKYADNYFDLGKELLTQEEYDLLKEMFDE